MTRDEILKLLELESKATQGKWLKQFADGIESTQRYYDGAHTPVSVPRIENELSGIQETVDVDFIVASRNSFKELCHVALLALEARDVLKHYGYPTGLDGMPKQLETEVYLYGETARTWLSKFDELDKKESV